MVLASTQHVTEMSTTNLPGGKGWPANKADNLTAICEPTVKRMWESRRLTTLWSSAACYRKSFTFFFYFKEKYCATIKKRMLFRETVAAYCENHTEHTDTLCVQNI
jgi:hypothetical protein